MNTTDTAVAPSPASNRGFLLVVIALIVAGLGIVAFVATNGGDDEDTAGADETGEPAVAVEQTAPAEIDGETLPHLPNSVAVGTADNDPAFGTAAPTMVGTDFDGTEVRIEADGRPKAVYFVAHWCPHCQREVPILQQLIAEGSAPDGLDLYVVSTAVDEGSPNFPPQTWLDAEGIEASIMRDDAGNSAFIAFGGAGFPYAVYLDGDNNVVSRTVGQVAPDAITQLWEATAATGG
ncbi:MAG: TlpA disulfide reductase family protein [Actinomycetota bacterium]